MNTLRSITTATILLLLGVPGGARAATIYDFSVTYDGTSANIDLGSDPIAGASLLVGDGFQLDVHAKNNDFWKVVTSASLSIYGSFFVQDGGVRTGNSTATFLLDGVQVAQDVDNGVIQNSAHIGAQVFTLPAGLAFDQVIIDYELLATTSTFTTIQSSPTVIHWSPFFTDSRVQYQQVAPEPATVMLLSTALLGAAVRRWRQHGG